MASPTPLADAGFWPVINLPSMQTLTCIMIVDQPKRRLVSHQALTPHGSVFSYLPPSDSILSSTRKGIACSTMSHVKYLQLTSDVNAGGYTFTVPFCVSSSLVKQVAVRPLKMELPASSVTPTNALYRSESVSRR